MPENSSLPAHNAVEADDAKSAPENREQLLSKSLLYCVCSLLCFRFSLGQKGLRKGVEKATKPTFRGQNKHAIQRSCSMIAVKVNKVLSILLS